MTAFKVVAYVDSQDWKDYGVDSIIKTVVENKHLGNGSIYGTADGEVIKIDFYNK